MVEYLVVVVLDLAAAVRRSAGLYAPHAEFLAIIPYFQFGSSAAAAAVALAAGSYPLTPDIVMLSTMKRWAIRKIRSRGRMDIVAAAMMTESRAEPSTP